MESINKDQSLRMDKESAATHMAAVLKRKLNLTEFILIHQARNYGEVLAAINDIRKMNNINAQYEPPMVCKITSVNFTTEGDLRLSTDTGLKINAPRLVIHAMDTQFSLPIAMGTPTEDMYEKAAAFFKELISIEGVKDVFEKYGAEIKPL